MTSLRLVIWSATSALAGFLFGFDTVVISGAEQTIQTLWHLSAGVHGIAMAAALYGTVVGSVISMVPETKGVSLEDMQARLGLVPANKAPAHGR